MPLLDTEYFYLHLKDQFTENGLFGTDQTDRPSHGHQATFEHAILKLTPQKLLAAGQDSTEARTPGVMKGLKVRESNYFYVMTHSKMLLKEMAFVLWMESQPAMAEDYHQYSAKQIAAVLSKTEKKFVVFKEKVDEFLNMHEEVQKKVIDKEKFIDFINFNLSAYWLYAYFTYLLHRIKRNQELASNPQADVALLIQKELPGFKNLVVQRRLVSILLANVTLVIKEVDYLNEMDFIAKLSKGTLLLGKRFDLTEGIVLQKDAQKKVLSSMIA